MSDRGRYDSAMFWLAFGTAASVIGLALMTIGVSRSASGANLLASPWFDGGLGLLALGAVLLLLSLFLFLGRRRDAREATTPSAASNDPKQASEQEAIRGYFKERERLFRMWERDRKNRR